MLSNPTSAIETRRRTHRRQNSTPNIEVAQLKKIPAVTGLQRANSHRGHRRGLSLDQPRLQISSKLTPTLGPISQDDIAVSINTNNAGPSQYRNTPVAQPSLAQPGLEQNQFQPVFPSPLAIQSQDFPAMNQSPHPLQSFSPHNGLSSPSPFTGSPSSHSPLNNAQPFSNRHPTLQQINALEEHIKSVYGHMGEVHINILPTPVPTPQKRASVAPVENLDVSPIPLKFDGTPELHLDPTLISGDLKLNLQTPALDHGYESPFYSSPNHSVSCSPQAPSVKSFMNELAPTSFPVTESMLFSSQTTLADVEIPMDSSGTNSPARSPRPVSIADLSIDGTIEQTGITAEEIQQYISEQDPVTHRWKCLYPGCDAKTFGRRENIRSHVQTHLGDRQYRCSHCGKCFVRQHDLKRHAKIHSGNKPYRCPCGGGFARQDALTRHRQRGMCIGGFPNAVRKQARRGRPRKLRPDMEERLEKAARARQRAHSTSSSNGSDVEDSPSPEPHVDATAIDTTRLVDLPEDDEIDNFGLNISNAELDSSEVKPALSSSFNLTSTNTQVYTRSATANLVFTPPASSPAEVDIKYLANSPHDSINSGQRTTPPPASAGATVDLSNTPPTSPLLCTSTSTVSESSLASAPIDIDHGLAVTMSILDELRLATADAPIDVNDPLGMSFASTDPTLATFGGLDYLKGDDSVDMSFTADQEDDGFRMWGIEDGEF